MRKDRLSTTIDLILLILFTVSSVLLCIQLYLSKILSFEWLFFVILFLIILLIALFSWILIKRNPFFRKIVMFLLFLSFILFSVSLAMMRTQSSHEEIVNYYQMNVVIPQSENDDLKNKKFGVLVSDRNHLEYFKDINEAFGMKQCETKEYQSVTNMLKGLKENDIQGMILSDHNLEIVKSKNSMLNYKIVASNVHEVAISHSLSKKTLNEPFSILLLMSDFEVPVDYVTKTDQCMILFVDPIEKTMQLMNIPNNLYIPNMAYDAYPDALYNISYNGIDNMLYSLQNVFGIEIDYFMKMNLNSLSKFIDVFQGIKLNDTVCDDSKCESTTKFYRSQEIVEYYKENHNLSIIFQSLFEKKEELTNTKLVNLLNCIKYETFTNLNINELRTFVSKIALDDTWKMNISNYDLLISNQPCISFDYYQSSNVSIVSEELLNQFYQYVMSFKHYEKMNHFEFDLNQLHNQIIQLPVNEKLITTNNMDWKINMLFSLLPKSSINPVEVEKWQGDSTIEHPNFNPNDAIAPFE